MTETRRNKFSRNMLITTSGILIAVLTVWAQLWTETAQLYHHADNMTSVGYGLGFIYWAIFASILTIVVTVVRGSVKTFALALFSYSLLLTIIEVFMSLIPIVVKTSENRNLWEPLINIRLPFWGNIIGIVVIPLLLLLIWVALACWIPKTREWFNKFC